MPNYDPSLDNSPITRVVSTNADGSPNYTGGGGGNVNLTQVGGSTIAIGQGTTANSLPVTLAMAPTDASPTYNNLSLGGIPLRTDSAGNLQTYSEVTTDQGTGRANWTGSSISYSPGTATFTNGSVNVTGTGFSATDVHYLDFIKISAQGEASWAQVSYINSDTSITLIAPYAGATATGAYDVSRVGTVTGSGATISVASGQLTIASGATNNAATVVYKTSAFPPLQNITGVQQLSISQRIANQDIYVGLEATTSSPRYFARFHFSGTNNTQVITETGYNPTGVPSASETETNTVTLPTGNTSTQHTYRVDYQYDQAVFSIDGTIVATHIARLPQIWTQFMNNQIRVVNGTGATTTSIVSNFIFSKAYARLDVLQATTQTTNVAGSVSQGAAAAIASGWPVINGELADTTGTFTNGTQTNSITTSGSLDGYESVTVSINGTYGTGTAVFEGSDDSGTTWYAIPLARSDSPTVEYGYTTLTNTNRMWSGQITGLDQFRVRSTAVASGTINVRISVSAAPTSDTAITSSNITDGTNAANVVVGDAGYNGIATAGASRQFSFTTSTPGAQNIGQWNVEGYSWLEINYTSVGAGLALTGQFAPSSGGVYVNSGSFSASQTNSPTSVIGTTVNMTYSTPVRGNYFQLAVSALTSGTFSGTVTLRSIAPPVVAVGSPSVAQSGTWTVGSNSATGSAVPANAFYMAQNSGGNLTGIGSYSLQTDGATGGSQVAIGLNTFNGTTADRARNNTTGVVIAAGATASNAGVTTTTYNANKAVIIINISAFTSGSLTVAVNGITSSGYSYPILTSTALAAVAVTPLRIFPGATASANAVANDMVPRSLQVVTTVSGTLTYGIDYELSV